VKADFDTEFLIRAVHIYENIRLLFDVQKKHSEHECDSTRNSRSFQPFFTLHPLSYAELRISELFGSDEVLLNEYIYNILLCVLTLSLF
jgi:hypothetical protein